MAASAALDGRSADLVVVFSSPRLACEELLAGVLDLARGSEVIGCSASATISRAGALEDGVLVLALGGGFRVRTASAPNHNGPRSAGRVVAERLGQISQRDEPSVVMLLSAVLAGNQSEIVRGAYGVLGGSVPLVGGSTGTEPMPWHSQQFHGSHVTEDALVGAAISGDGPIAIGIGRGQKRIGRPLVVTRSDHGRILELDGQPALDVYLQRLRAPAEAWTHPDAFATFATAHSLGLRHSSGPVQARWVGAPCFEERSLQCAAEVPQGGLVWLTAASPASAIAATEQACAEALGGLHGSRPRALVVFDCLGRKQLLGEDGVREEQALLRDAADGAALAGFYTFGEIARASGVNGFHNQTIVVLAIG